MANPTFADFKKLTAHAKDYGFVFQSSEIYDGLAAAWYSVRPNRSVNCTAVGYEV